MKMKMVAAVLLSGIGSTITSRRQYANVWQNMPLHVAGYCGYMGVFSGLYFLFLRACLVQMPYNCVHTHQHIACAVIQETLRGVRTKHDAWNSLAAGALAGGFAAGYFQGVLSVQRRCVRA
jgi:hypothetical protein